MDHKFVTENSRGVPLTLVLREPKDFQPENGLIEVLFDSKYLYPFFEGEG